MPVPWVRILDISLGAMNAALGTHRHRAAAGASEEDRLALGSRSPSSLEATLAGVMVAAVKEAFDRDSRRLELEREQVETERARAERALRLELRRQAGEREIGRLRLLAGVAVVSWLGTLFFSTRILSTAAGGGGRAALGVGWALLLAALAASFAAQARVGNALDRIDE